jgi:spermidine synthase
MKYPVRLVYLVAPLLFASGACALVYQTVWLREFRLIFGASTAASAAVLAIFMAGLGVGSAILGSRVDRARVPLALYGWLECGIALVAAMTPALADIARELYLGMGGSPALGDGGATLVRLLLSSLVLLVPTFLMGGTLPAAARAVVGPDDGTRGSVAVLYGANALGAMTGALASTFFLLEHLGNRRTLWLACAINVLISSLAIVLARRNRARSGAQDAPAQPAPEAAMGVEVDAGEPPARALPVYLASGVAGFAFLLMELVWYRMLGPLLGGSVYTFGIILAVALFGIGAGSVAYRLWYRDRVVTMDALAFTCALEALLLALPFWMGDHVAMFALSLRAYGMHSFAVHVGGWAVVTVWVVLPASLVSGFQFPLLIGLLGRGNRNVGRQAGIAYAWNTLGAIAGSLCGGFGLLPFLSAPGAWRVSIAMLGALSLFLALLAPARRQGREVAIVGAAMACAAFVLSSTGGPGPAWRHSGIGAGRADYLLAAPHDALIDQQRNWRHQLVWEADGVESSVALYALQSYSFLVNGKSDGSVRGDAATFVMSGMIGAMLHPHPATAFVVGLGTGSSAGWLAMDPRIERVDVVELEPRIADVAAACVPTNGDPLHNPKVHLAFGDAREYLLTSHARYDLILSQPSNPYRAGIASMFTREFYEAVAKRLDKDGIFVQWLQAYEVTPDTVRTVYATLGAEFPMIETWQTQLGDLVFVATREPIRYDTTQLRERIASEPYRSAIRDTWQVETLEGVMAHFASGSILARSIESGSGVEINSDDDNRMEFAFAKSIGQKTGFDPRLESTEHDREGIDRPLSPLEGLDWDEVQRQREAFYALSGQIGPIAQQPRGMRATRVRMIADFRQGVGNLAAASQHWRDAPFEPVDSIETAMVAEALAEMGDARSAPYIERLRILHPIEADFLAARLALRGGDADRAAELLVRAFVAYRSDAWPWPPMALRAILLAQEVAAAAQRPKSARAIYDAIKEPFAVHMWDHFRQLAQVSIAKSMGDDALLAASVRNFEPNAPWHKDFLQIRADVYRRTNDPLAQDAQRDLDRILQDR